MDGDVASAFRNLMGLEGLLWARWEGGETQRQTQIIVWIIMGYMDMNG
jgi:hypothetical protein